MLAIALTCGAAITAAMDDESIWESMGGPLSCVLAAVVLWSSCEHRIRTVRRELES